MEYLLFAEGSSPDLVAQYGFVGFLAVSAMAIGAAGWKATKWVGSRLFDEDKGIITRFFVKQEKFLDDVSGTLGDMAITVKAGAAELAIITNPESANGPMKQYSTIRTNIALSLMADAILAATPSDLKDAVRPHVDQIKHVLNDRR